MSLLGTIAGVFIGFITAFYAYRKFWAHRYFKRLGIPGPSPNWLFGNLHEMADESTRHHKIAEWTRLYGAMYGFYEGSSPILVVSDINVANEVFVRQFSNVYYARKMYPMQPHPDNPHEPINVFFARGERWKRIRNILNPTFTSGKLRLMTPMMKKVIEVDLMEKLDQQTNKPINVHDWFQLLSLDVICKCAFGVDVGGVRSEGKNNSTFECVQQTFHLTVNHPYIVIVMVLLPEFYKVLELLEKFKTFVVTSIFQRGTLSDPVNWLHGLIGQIIDERKGMTVEERSARHDMLQMMIETEDKDAVGKMSTEATALGAISSTKYERALTPEEIKGQVYVFMLAGYETTSSTLAYVTHELAVNPDCQDKLRAEIDAKFGSGKVAIDYESVMELEYLDAVISETLRMYPIAFMVTNRLAMADSTLGGYAVPKGCTVQMDVWSIHHDASAWGPENAHKFHPERFLESYPTATSRPASSYMPFGFGPRLCVGMRFALLEIKLTLVNMLLRYRIERCNRTEEPLSVKIGVTMAPQKGVWVQLAALQSKVQSN